MNRQPLLPQQPQSYTKNEAPSFKLNKRAFSQKRNIYASSTSLQPKSDKLRQNISIMLRNSQQVHVVDSSYQQLPNLVSSYHVTPTKSRSKKPQTIIIDSLARFNDCRSSFSPSIGNLSVHKIDNRFVSSQKRNHLRNIHQNTSSKAGLTTKASQPTTVTADPQRHARVKSKEDGPEMMLKHNYFQGALPRSQSEDALEEWSQIFNLQQNRWQDEFDDLNARHMSNFERQKLLKLNRPVPNMKPGTFTIPDDCLPVKDRSVRKGQRGTQERLKRDQIRARRIKRQTLEPSEIVDRIMHKDHSTLTIQQPSSSQLDRLGVQNSSALQSHRNFNHMMPRTEQSVDDHERREQLTSSLNNSTEIGRVLYSKQERQVKLPSIYTKNLKQLHKKMHKADGSPQMLLASSLISSLQNSRHGSQSRISKTPFYGSVERTDSKEITIDTGGNPTPTQKDTNPHIYQAHEQSPSQMSAEVRKLFRNNPDCNPFKILAERSSFSQPKNTTDSVNHRQQIINQLQEKTKTIERALIDEQVKRGIQTNSISKLADTVGVDIKHAVKEYGTIAPSRQLTPKKVNQQQRTATTGKKQAVVTSKLSEKIRISRRKMLEPLKVANNLLALAKATENEPPEEPDTFLSFHEKMGQQQIQIGQVRKFVENQIENELQRERIKHSLVFLENTLSKQGVTLREMIAKHTNELHARANQMQNQEPQKISEMPTAFKKGLNRFELPENSIDYDFVRLLESASSLAPLIKYQRRLKERSKRRYQKRLAAQRAKAEEEGTLEDVEDLDSGIEGAYQSQRKMDNRRVFCDQDQSIAHFIGQIKRLIFLHDQSDKAQAGLTIETHADESDFDWTAEPEIYKSDSGESKYSNEDKEEKDHLATGENALINAMAKYKNADKIIQKNELEGQSHLTSHLVHYMHEMNRNGHIPKGFGFVNRKNSIDEIDGSNCKITDQHAKAIAGSLDRAKYVNKLIFRNTGLTDQQGISIVRAMDRTLIKHLDISYNPQLSYRFYEELFEVLADPACLIERLEIEGNKIGDRLVHELMQALIQSKNIVYLNVSRNQIEDAGARDLAQIIEECPKLRLLFMHYNRVRGFGGSHIASAISRSKSIQVFDISWNAVCSTGLTKKKEEITEEQKKTQEVEKKKQKKQKKPAVAAKLGEGVQRQDGTKPAGLGFSQLIAGGFGETWSDAFAANKSLLHIDMSHNHLEQTDVEIIAQGLKDNQQILGIHFAGNYGDIDTQGFVKPGKPLSVAQGGTIMTRLPMNDEIQVGVIHNQRSLELAQNSNCWLCEGWTEHRFTYEPGLSDNNPNHDEFKPIKLHLDIDHYSGDLMMKAQEMDPAYQIYRMLPPGGHRYFFSIDGKPGVAKNQAKTDQQAKNEKKPYLDMSKLELPKFSNKTSQNPTPKGKKKAKPKSFSRAKEPEQTQPDVDYYELELPEVNYIENIAQTRTIYSKEQLAIQKTLSKDKFVPVIGRVERMIDNMNCVPRPGPKGLGNRNKVREPWNFSLSVFANYKVDSEKLLNDCFEIDWKRTKIEKIVKNVEDRENFKTYCRSIYKYFREVYKFVSGSDPMGDVFCIGVNVFSDLCTTGLDGLIDGRYLKVADLDLERIKTNASEQNSKFNPKNNLVRHNFLEVFIRLCDQKYLKMQAGGPEISTMPKAFKMMFETELLPYFSQFDSQQWRNQMLWKEELDFTLKISLDPLRAIYKRYIGKNALPGGQQYMSFTEFNDCIIAANCLSENFGAKQIGNMYNLAMMTQVDEIDKERHINMIFVEFLEAIVRVAEKTEIPHCVIDQFVWGVDEVAPDMRESYAKRDIVFKLEAFILFLISGNLSHSTYTKYVASLAEYKGMGLFANDLDTGNLNLNVKRS